MCLSVCPVWNQIFSEIKIWSTFFVRLSEVRGDKKTMFGPKLHPLLLRHGTRAVDAVRWPVLFYVAGSLLGKCNAGVARLLLFLVRQMEMVHRKTNNFLLSSDRKTEQEWQTSCLLDVKSMRMTWHFRRLCVVQRWSAVFSVCILFRLGKEAGGVHRFGNMWWRRYWKVCHECQPWQHLLNVI